MQQKSDNNSSVSSSLSDLRHPSYKTLLCHQWLANGTCPRGSVCCYAHGTNELRARAADSTAACLYKSELCKFWLSGKCAHGEQCNYAHGQVELKAPTRTFQQFIPFPNDQSSGNISHPGPHLISPFLPSASFCLPTLQFPKVPPNMDSIAPYKISNPPAPEQPLWGQPPSLGNSLMQPPSLGSLMQPNHFQPLTRSAALPVPSFSQEQMPEKNLQPYSPLQMQTGTFTSPSSLAEIANRFSTMNLEVKQNIFDTNDDADFPTLGINNKNSTNDEKIKSPDKQVPISFAKVAASKTAAFKRQLDTQKGTSIASKKTIAPRKQSLNSVATHPSATANKVNKKSSAKNAKKEKPKLERKSLSLQEYSNCATSSKSIDVEKPDPIMQLTENDNYLNYLRAMEAELNNSIEGRDNDDDREQEWHTATNKKRNRSALANEPPPNHASPFTDDGYQEDYACSDEEAAAEERNGSGEASRSNTPGALNQSQQQYLQMGSLDANNPFYKTVICRYWKASRDDRNKEKCIHGKKCFYAHGEKDLIKLDQNYYKTALCEHWNREEPCPYGDSCNFAHGPDELRPTGVKGHKNRSVKPLFYNRHRIRKPRGTQTIQPFQSYGAQIEKLTLVKAGNENNVKEKKA